MQRPGIARGRGATSQPPNRFERLHIEFDPGEDPPAPRTQILRDHSRTVITRNESPDLGFAFGLNPYRGCEHGCSYCYARPYHEFLGYSSGLDFETRILAKIDAASLLRAELASPRWKPAPIAMSGVTDCYQPVERKLRITRECLEVLADCRQPVGLITKNHLVTRDIDLLSELARHRAASVHISLTTLDSKLSTIMEPRASLPAHRLDAIRQLASSGIPVGVSLAPIIPGINDHEIPSLLDAAAEAGAAFAFHTILRLPHAVKDIFRDWLEAHFPDRARKVLDRIRELREGKLNSSEFHARLRGSGPLAREIDNLFKISSRRAGLNKFRWDLSAAAFRRPAGAQAELDLG